LYPWTHFCKYYGLYLHFLCEKALFSPKILYFCTVYARGASAKGVDTTYWKSDTRRFVFDRLNVGNSNPLSKTIAEVTPTGVYIRSRSVPRANYALTGTLLGAFVYTTVWVSYSVRSIREASDGLNDRTSRCRYPIFRLCGWQNN